MQLVRLPYLINGLSAFEGFFATFHNSHDFVLTHLGINASMFDLHRVILSRACADKFGIPEYREIGIVGRENELLLQLINRISLTTSS